jgi:subtilisin family serine protease
VAVAKLTYFSAGRWHDLSVRSAATYEARPPSPRERGSSPSRVATLAVAATVPRALYAQEVRLANRFRAVHEAEVRVQTRGRDSTRLIPTESLVIDGARTAEVTFARNKHGFEVTQEGRFAKVLMRAPADAPDGVVAAFEAAAAIHRRGNVGAAHPNFLRIVRHPAPAARNVTGQWNLDNDGRRGLPGADVHALAAWTITRGNRDVRVAVLDEGVDTQHPYLQPAVVAEADFVDRNPHARPEGDDAHGTACAGIIASSSENAAGLAPDVGLVAVRIAKSDARGNWIFDDFDTADAIDWAWDDANAGVLSNSWGGGPPADVIIRAFDRARTRGRAGKGAVVVVAAGNEQTAIDFPGNLPGIMTVGASNEWDERKTRASRDGEHWWGSNFGPSMDVLAPGVHIVTTDIRGSRGYSRTLVTGRFNGTSSAAPHVAAAAALAMSVNPALTEERVRDIVNASADKLQTRSNWNRYQGHGRLNTYAALRLARRG